MKWQKPAPPERPMAYKLGEWRWAWCLLAPLLLSIGAPVSAADPIIHAPPSHGTQASAPTHDAPAAIPVWRTITLGAPAGVDGYRDALDAAGIKVGVAADEILGRPAFSYATMERERELELAIVSVAELGLEADASSYSEVYARAKRIGLELCPAEVAPRLRLDYRDQPLGEALDIAMEPVATYGGEPTILALVNFGSGLALIGSDGRSGAMVPRTRRFVFALPARGRLEARRDIEPVIP
jgi:hypothetical protein